MCTHLQKNVSKPDISISIPSLSDILNFLLVAHFFFFFFFALKKYPKKLDFQTFLLLKEVLVASFSETGAHTLPHDM